MTGLTFEDSLRFFASVPTAVDRCANDKRLTKKIGIHDKTERKLFFVGIGVLPQLV